MNTNDIKVWQDLLETMQEVSAANEVAIQEISGEVALQQQRNKTEVARLLEQMEKQEAEIIELQNKLQAENLFALPSDKDNLSSFEAVLADRLSATRRLMDAASRLLSSNTTPKETWKKLLKPAEDAVIMHPASSFNRDNLLGNWVHYFSPDLFTCHSFWDDGAFKEYDFDAGKLVEEKEGVYDAANGKVRLVYSDGKTRIYDVTGYSDDCIDYLIEGSQIRFDYMPENLLNKYLESPKKA